MIVDILKRQNGNKPIKLGTFIGPEEGLEDIKTAINLYTDTEEGWNTDFILENKLKKESKHFINHPIIGFGIKINYENIDILKYARATGVDEDFYESIKQKVDDSTYKNVMNLVEDLGWNFNDDFTAIIDNSNIPVYFKSNICFTHSEEDGDFLLYYPTYPWKLTEEEKLITEDTLLVAAITNILMSIYKDHINSEEIKKEIDEVASYFIR